ncbi:ATP-binding protein [Streptomyces dysideae]|uniref:Orc1-like AAA ATPase domain-containing protein n=1 Tax=Streptomyces dysideae TaxID=909626 RepID=A0A117RYM6_9ACTN|nr:ATP-binding protein [Streptomyces dysideae]KUO16942.1 hypothetical protein AQJ91_33540 [Streptomyces dysideae]
MEASGERAVGLGGSARNVATGDFIQQIDQATVLPAEAFLPVGELPKRLVKLPAPTRLFVGRERELALLDGPSAVVCVHGLGGIGKSTLVAKWAQDSTGTSRRPQHDLGGRRHAFRPPPCAGRLPGHPVSMRW